MLKMTMILIALALIFYVYKTFKDKNSEPFDQEEFERKLQELDEVAQQHNLERIEITPKKLDSE